MARGLGRPDRLGGGAALLVLLLTLLALGASSASAQSAKPLYLQSSAGLVLSRNPPPGAEPFLDILELEAVTFTQAPPTAAPLTLAAGNLPVVLWIGKGGGPSGTRTVEISLAYAGPVSGVIGTDTQTFTIDPAAAPVIFNIALGADLPLPPGSTVVLTVTNLSTGSGNRKIRLYPNDGLNRSTVNLNALTVIQVDDVRYFDAPYPGGIEPGAFDPGDTVYLRAWVSDPFGSFDVAGATVDVSDPLGAPMIVGAPMVEVFDSGADIKIFEYVYTVPLAGPFGAWETRITAIEGTEGTVTDVGTDVFQVGGPDILVLKTVIVTDDPVNGSSNPKLIPGANALYSLRATNEGPGPVDADTVRISDSLPSQVELFVGDLGGPGAGPVLFLDGVPSSGLTYAFGGLGDPSDDLAFDDGSATFAYTPVPGPDGYDANVTALRVDPKGTFDSDTGGGSPSFELRFRARVR